MIEGLQGIFPPVPTPFDSNGDVDHRALASNATRWMTTRLSGLLVLGSNGEASHLDEDESTAVIETVRPIVPRDRVLLVGTGRESTRGTIEATRRAASAGADAVLVRTPSAFKSQMTADALAAHFTAIADASPVPVLLYNLPGVTGVTMTVPLVKRLSEHPNIAGIKETSPELERLGQFTALNGFRVFCGWAPVIYPALCAGASGGILAIANIWPDRCVDLFDHVKAGRHTEALAAQRCLTSLAQLVTTIHGVPGLKAALDLAGYHGGPVRSPLLPVSTKVRDEIAAALNH